MGAISSARARSTLQTRPLRTLRLILKEPGETASAPISSSRSTKGTIAKSQLTEEPACW